MIIKTNLVTLFTATFYFFDTDKISKHFFIVKIFCVCSYNFNNICKKYFERQYNIKKS